MNFSALFIQRPVGTALLTIALALAGALAYQLLPVAPLPQVEFSTITVTASLPGASPETMASAVATPLERQFGRIAGLNEMTSVSSLGATRITLQFEDPHGSFEYNIGILWRDGLEIVGEGNAGAAEADVRNGALPRR